MVVQLDHVGSMQNAAAVIAPLHSGEKRLVFVDSRRRAEELGSAPRARNIDTYVSYLSRQPQNVTGPTGHSPRRGTE